jgi:predicted choloylglycine hydrolase
MLALFDQRPSKASNVQEIEVRDTVMSAFLQRGAVVICLLSGASLAGWAHGGDSKGQPVGTIVEDRVVAGSPKDFLEVRHIVLKGTNEEIGAALAQIAQNRFSARPAASGDPRRTRVERRYLEKHYPILFERMRGVAKAFGKGLDDDHWDFTGLAYSRIRAGCSVVYFPPALTVDGTGVVSRDYDFTTGTLFGTRPAPGELGATARPYVIEMHPDQGFSSIAVCSYDLLSGVLDGINSEGLTVALLADDELMGKYRMEPTLESAVGLGVQQVLRFLLDTCADVEQAKDALLMTKQFYEAIPVHYIIADRHGKAFVWEYSQAHNKEYIIENDGKPLVTTNFSLHRYQKGGKPPSAELARKVCPRYCRLIDGMAMHPDKFSLDFIKENHKAVDAVGPSLAPGRPVGRTLWHALYFPERRQLQVSFYLRDESDTNNPGKSRVVRSDYVDFSLRGGHARREP